MCKKGSFPQRIDGYPQQEIADILDISVRSVYNAVYRYHKKSKPLTSENKCVKL